MGDVNQLLFVKTLAGSLAGPILEVGSRDYGNTQNFRALFKGVEYLGIDMQAGKGVDLVLDLTADFESLESALEGRRFGTIICMSVLEHCSNPFKMAQNIEKLLAEGGLLVVGVPFVWELHGFPDDYWRFTPSGIRVLFRNLDFTDLIASQAILEHLIDPFKHLEDCYGLLNPGGHMVFSTVIPGFQYHRYPVDCLRFFPDWFEEVARRLEAQVVLRSMSKTTTLIAYTLRKPD